MKRNWAIGLALAAILVRFILLGTTLGTVDILYWKMWLELIEEHGIIDAYRVHSELNHPPFSLLILLALGSIAEKMGILVSEPLRVLQILADLLTAGCLILIGRRVQDVEPTDAALLFLLAPTAIFVSGFHGNTDSLMISLVAVAIVLALREDSLGSVGSGVVLGLATGIKIVPIVLAPFFFSVMQRRRWSFLAGLTAACVVIFAPGLMHPEPFIRNVFGYSPRNLPWGLVAFANVVDGGSNGLFARLASTYELAARFLIVGALLALWMVRGRRSTRTELPSVVALALLILLTLAPGAGVQYLVWPLPFLIFLLGTKRSTVYVLVTSIHLFVAYTIWSRGFPWFLADAIRPAPGGEIVIWSGIAAWLAIALLTMIGAGRVFGATERPG